jgi:hypothetical protein
MKLPVFSHKCFHSTAGAIRRRRSGGAAIEPLEARIAPATLVSPTTVTFLEKNGDTATVTILKPLFTAANVGKVFTFDTGSVNASNSMPQQLETLNITALGAGRRGIDITISAKTPGGNPGTVDVGYINASDIDLGNVTVDGDLGRIAVGDLNFSTQGLQSLTVDSLGALGLTTQAPHGNLNSLIAGGVGSITVKGDIDQANIGIGGGAKGLLGTLIVEGSIIGGAATGSGSVNTQGGITHVTVDGSILGGPGANSGVIGATGGLGNVLVEGPIIGGAGSFSGAILSTKAMGSVVIGGGLTGGSGANSGEVGTASSLGSVEMGYSITGGSGPLSGVILASKNIASVSVVDDLVGGSGAGSGQIGSGGSIGTVTINGSMTDALIHAHLNIESISLHAGREFQTTSGGSGMANSTILADDGSIGTITADAEVEPYAPAFANSFVLTPKGSIGSITANGEVPGALFLAISPGIVDSGFDAGGSIGSIDSTGSIIGSVFVAGIALGPNFSVTGAGTFNSVSAASFGFGSSSSSIAAHIGAITVTNDSAGSPGGESSLVEISSGGGGSLIESSTFLAGVHGAGADGKFGTKDDLVPAGSSIGAITSAGGLNTVFVESGDIGKTTSGAIVNTTYLSTDTAVTAAGIGAINVTATIPGTESLGGSVVKAVASTTSNEGIAGSTFSSNAGIGDVTVTLGGVRAAGTNAGIASSTFEAGHALGAVSVTDNATGSAGVNYGIFKTTFNGGLDGYGGAADISASLTDDGPAVNSAAIAYSDFDASVCSCMSANMGSIAANNAGTAASAAGILDSVFRVHGSIGPISAEMTSGSPTAPAIEGSTFSAFGSIGDINVYGAVVADSKGKPSRFLAGYDIGTDMIFGNEDLSAKSLALQSGQSIGDVSVSGYFSGSDIIASINPGAAYTFGDSVAGTSADNNTNVGTGGSIGLVNIGYNVPLDGSPFSGDTPTAHAIEAANFAVAESTEPTVTAFGNTSGIPVVLSYTDGGGEVRITNLTQVIL